MRAVRAVFRCMGQATPRLTHETPVCTGSTVVFPATAICLLLCRASRPARGRRAELNTTGDGSS